MRREKKYPAEHLEGKKYPAHQTARKKILDDQKSPKRSALKSSLTKQIVKKEFSFFSHVLIKDM